MTLNIEMKLSDYIERRQKDLMFEKIAEELTSRSVSNLSEECVKMDKSDQETAQETSRPNNYERNPMQECKVETKDKVVIVPGQASKFDSGKPRMDLLPVKPLKQVAEILTYGADKYGPDNWREGKPIAHSRHYAGIQRHLMAYWSGEDLDPETGKSHLAHAACGILFFLELSQSHPELDDRCRSALQWGDK